MSRRRYLSTSISTDPRVTQLGREHGDFAALLYTWMIPHAERDLTLTADPEVLLFLVVPGMRHRTVSDVEQAIEAMIDVGLLRRMPGGRHVQLRRRIDDGSIYARARAEWNSIRRKLSRIVFERDGYCCVQCGVDRRLTVDHIEAIARGGGHDLDNLQTLCRPCNSRKGDH